MTLILAFMLFQTDPRSELISRLTWDIAAMQQKIDKLEANNERDNELDRRLGRLETIFEILGYSAGGIAAAGGGYKLLRKG